LVSAEEEFVALVKVIVVIKTNRGKRCMVLVLSRLNLVKEEDDGVAVKVMEGEDVKDLLHTTRQ